MNFHPFLQDLITDFGRKSPKLLIDIAMEKAVWYICGKVAKNQNTTKEKVNRMKPRRASDKEGPRDRRIYYRRNSETGNIRH